MDKQSRDLLTKEILNQLVKVFELDEESVTPLDGFENHLYRCVRQSEKYVLRISHDVHRQPREICGEIAFMNYLSQNGVSVPRPISAKNGLYVIEVSASDESVFSGVLFSWAQGEPPYSKELWNESLFEKMGKLTGKIHRLSKEFTLDSKNALRKKREEDGDFFIGEYLPNDEQHIAQKLDTIRQECEHLPRSKDSFGMVHYDFHGGNFFIHDGEITIFDFDDCGYHWFIADIAIALFYAVIPDNRDSQKAEQGKTFIGAFMRGYNKENKLNSSWYKQIPLFLKERELQLYGVIHRSCNLHELEGWTKVFMHNRKKYIENDEPYIDLDFTKIIDECI